MDLVSRDWERSRRLDAGRRPDYAIVRLESISEGKSGKVDVVQPFAIDSEKGGLHRSVAVFVRSERLVGRVLQCRHDAKTCNVPSERRPDAGAVRITLSSGLSGRSTRQSSVSVASRRCGLS
jgi:hypothetical protein